MPAVARKQGDKWRVMHESEGGHYVLVRNKKGTPVDGGGHDSRRMAVRQARAINAGKESDD